MHLLVDLQALQTEQSRHRGIGRYSLALFRAMVTAGDDVRFSVLMNSAFPHELEEAWQWIADLLPREELFVFDAPGRTSLLDARNAWRSRTAAALLELKARAIAPDFVHVASLFEVSTDDSVTTIANGRDGWAATIYDLIPWYHRDIYLANPDVRRCYMAKLDRARHAELLFAISDSARREAMETLDQPADRVIDIQGDVDALFHQAPVPADRRASLLARLELRKPFVMYTAGIDFRKNIEALIQTFAMLPGDLRARHQLLIVCKVLPEQREQLMQVARRAGLASGDVVCSGFVTDTELADLYRLCRLFVFPSLHEGFGMPILEAMRCGAPVIGSNCSSMPEILGIADAQFDPRSKPSMAQRIAQALQDAAYRDRLIENSARQQARFSWAGSARKVLDGFRMVLADRPGPRAVSAANPTLPRRPRLAFVSPLPPEQSGIADYSSELIPALSAHYDITLVTDLAHVDHPWLDGTYATCSQQRFRANARSFDRIVYQVGNSSAFHAATIDLLRDHPGTVVLHDFFLSNMLDHLDATAARPRCLRTELFRSHGYAPLIALRAGPPQESVVRREHVVRCHPASRFVFDCGYGTIVHSAFSVHAAARYYGVSGDASIREIPHIRAVPKRGTRAAARLALGIADDAVLVCSFGLIGPTKLNLELVRAWLAGPVARKADHFLYFLGPVGEGPYDVALRQLIKSSGLESRIRLMGFVDDATFQLYLEAADCAVQLRTDSCGETSGAVLHCMANGLPVIVNRHGTLAELPADATRQIAERFTTETLSDAIESLLADPAERAQRIERGLEFIRTHCDARSVAQRYFDAIETFYRSHPNARLDAFLGQVLAGPSVNADAGDAERVAAIAEATLPAQRLRYLLIDIDALFDDADEASTTLVGLWEAGGEPAAVRIEPVRWDGRTCRFARSHTFARLGIVDVDADDDVVDVHAGDILVMAPHAALSDPHAAWLRWQRLCGLRVVLAMAPDRMVDPGQRDAPPTASLLACADLAVASTPEDRDAMRRLFSSMPDGRRIEIRLAASEKTALRTSLARWAETLCALTLDVPAAAPAADRESRATRDATSESLLES